MSQHQDPYILDGWPLDARFPHFDHKDRDCCPGCAHKQLVFARYEDGIKRSDIPAIVDPLTDTAAAFLATEDEVTVEAHIARLRAQWKRYRNFQRAIDVAFTEAKEAELPPMLQTQVEHAAE